MRIVHKRYRDAQRACPAAECALCGGELYRGDVCWRFSGRVFCEDCVVRWLVDELAPYRLIWEARP